MHTMRISLKMLLTEVKRSGRHNVGFVQLSFNYLFVCVNVL